MTTLILFAVLLALAEYCQNKEKWDRIIEKKTKDVE